MVFEQPDNDVETWREREGLPPSIQREAKEAAMKALRPSWISPFEPHARLHTYEQARTAAYTMMPLYHIPGLAPAMDGGTGEQWRKGSLWEVPLVYGEPGDKFLAHAPVVGAIRLHHETATLVSCSSRDAVLAAVHALPHGVNAVMHAPMLHAPVERHEMAWRYAMYWLQRAGWSTEIVCGTPWQNGASEWVVPIFLADPSTGERVWQRELHLDAHTGLVFQFPTDIDQRTDGARAATLDA